jgi:hypothetical protein
MPSVSLGEAILRQAVALPGVACGGLPPAAWISDSIVKQPKSTAKIFKQKTASRLTPPKHVIAPSRRGAPESLMETLRPSAW